MAGRVPKVGDRVIALVGIFDPFTRSTVPEGTPGLVIGVGPDARFGLVNVRFEREGITDGLPVFVTGATRTVRYEGEADAA